MGLSSPLPCWANFRPRRRFRGHWVAASTRNVLRFVSDPGLTRQGSSVMSAREYTASGEVHCFPAFHRAGVCPLGKSPLCGWRHVALTSHRLGRTPPQVGSVDGPGTANLGNGVPKLPSTHRRNMKIPVSLRPPQGQRVLCFLNPPTSLAISLRLWRKCMPHVPRCAHRDGGDLVCRRQGLGSSSVPVPALPKAWAHSDTGITRSLDREGTTGRHP